MNSFRSVEPAIGYEIERQGRALDTGEPLVMETRGWDEAKQATYRMRGKETSDESSATSRIRSRVHVEAA